MQENVIVMWLFFAYIICGAITLIINISFKYAKKINSKRRKRKKEKYKKILRKGILVNPLKIGIYNMISLEDALTEMQQEKEILYTYIRKTKKYLPELLKKYKNKNGIKKAFILKFIHWYFPITERKDEIINLIISKYYLLDKSRYCKANAIDVICKIGNCNDVLSTLLLLNNNKINYSHKFLIDDLNGTNISKEKLSKMLFDNYKNFNEYYKVIIIEFITLNSSEYGERLMNIMENGSKEEKCACIKYYNNNYYEGAKKDLINFVENSSDEDWEYAALAATALVNYLDAETIITLENALKSPNWYVRNNSAEALKKMILDKQYFYDLLERLDDKFAKDMILYKLDEMKEEVKYE